MSSVIYESIKALEMRTLILFSLSFPNSTILSSFFFFLFIIDLYFSIPAVITQIFIPIEELVIPTGKATNEANVDIEKQPVTFEA